MVDLVPAPNELGLASPALGPWFGPSGGGLPSLEAPQADLSVPVAFAPDQRWLAPANGLVSYYIASPTRPEALARLRAENGQPAFTDGRGIILFMLLAETELRLHALTRSIPSPAGGSSPHEQPTRPRVRWLAYELELANITRLGQLLPSGFPADVDEDGARAAYLGLKIADDDSLTNGERPVTLLRRPTAAIPILKNGTGTTLNGSLWAFDHRGRPVDPGAVAAWWRYLATVAFDNLWASTESDEQRTAEYAARHSVHLVSAHEGPLSAAHRARVQVTDLTATAGSHALYARSGDAPTLGLTAAPDPDDAPVPRAALLPHGTYDDPASNGAGLLAQWGDAEWPDVLNRDFARVALVDVEQHLVGLDRTNAAQANARTRLPALRNSAPIPFFTRTDQATAEVMGMLRDGSAAVVMAPVMDRDWGALEAPDFGDGLPPETLDYQVRALRGEGSESGGVVTGQRVVVIFDNPSDPLPENAWVRVWPHALDADTGRRAPLNGGAGRADASGRAHVVVALADGAAQPAAPMSFDVLVRSGDSARLYGEQRFDRPAVIAGSRVDLPSPPAGPAGFAVLVCEKGATLERGAEAYGSGQALLAIPDDPSTADYALVNLASLEDTDYDPLTLRRAAGANDTLIVTTPAFGTTPEGDLTSPAPGGAALIRRTRSGLTDTITEMGRPVPTMERRELAAVDAGLARGLVGGVPGRAAWHEAPPAQLGHPGMPAAAEVHGAAAALEGPAAIPLVELLRERRALNLLEFVQAAQLAPALPADPDGPSAWSVVLETLTRGVVGDAVARNFAAAGFTPGQAWLDLKNDIESATGLDLDTVIDSATFNDEDLARALDRMIGKTRDGSQQTSQSVQAAVERAEDFIYIESPCLDALDSSSGAVGVVNRIVARLQARPGLIVLIACPEQFLPNQPKRLNDVRKAAICAALKTLTDAAGDRVALFVPTAGPDRRLHMATTTVIVDDAYALVGSTHLWRRGLSFDSSLAVAGFDERISHGRPAAIRALRRQLLAERLGLPQELTPDDPCDVLLAVTRLAAAGGLGRIAPDVFPARADATGTPTQDAWNPDGGAGGVSDWFLFFNGLSAGVSEEISNAVR